MKDLTMITMIIIIHQTGGPGSLGVRSPGLVPALSQTYSYRFLSSLSLNFLICDLEITIPISQVLNEINYEKTKKFFIFKHRRMRLQIPCFVYKETVVPVSSSVI